MGLFQKSLMYRLVGYFLILSLCVVLIVGISGFLYTRKSIEISLYEHLESLADMKEEMLNRWVAEQRAELELLGSLPRFKSLTASLIAGRLPNLSSPARAGSEGEAAPGSRAYRELAGLLDLYTAHGPGFDELFLLSPVGGEILVSTNHTREGDYRVVDRYFIEGKSGTWVQNVYPSPVTLKPAMTISTPVRDEQGRLTGVLAAHLDLAVMDLLVKDRTGLGQSGESYLVDRFNIMVSGEEFGWNRYERGYHSHGINAALSGREGRGRYENYAGEPVLGIFRFLEERDLALLIEIGRKEVFGQVWSKTISVILIGCAAVFFLGIGVILLARQIAGPVLALSRSARRIAEGDLETRAPHTRQDEIGELSDSFNIMAERLQHLYRELSLKEERFRRFFEEDLTGDFICTPDGTLTSCNPALAEMLGFDTVDELSSHNLFAFFLDSDRVRRLLGLLEESRKLEYYEEELRDRNGNPVYIIANAIGKFDTEGNLAEIKGYLFDNTERKQLEEQLRQSQKIEAIGVLAGGVAHDFNNILTAINGYCELLVNGLDENAHLQSYACEIEKAGNRAAALTRQLLAFSRKQIMKPQLVDINQLIRDVEQLLRRLIGENVNFITELGSGLSKVTVDPGQLEQVVMNLVVNARDAMPGGGTLMISTSEVELDEKFVARHVGTRTGRYVLLEVSDTGEGMDQTLVEHIFEPFFTTKEVGKGTGLGLATVYGIVKQSGGCIFVESTPGQGSTFKIYLPPARSGAEKPSAEAPDPGDSGPCETILLVEDEDPVRSMLSSGLARYGYRVLQACDGSEALNLADSHEEAIHLLLTDVVMPRMNGRELAEKVKARRSDIKVLYMSGYPDRELEPHGISDNGSFIQKPFTPERLVEKVRQILGV